MSGKGSLQLIHLLENHPHDTFFPSAAPGHILWFSVMHTLLVVHSMLKLFRA